MYSPISLNVIRQALSWSGAPKPILMTPGKTVLTSNNGTSLAQILVTFPFTPFMEMVGRHYPKNVAVDRYQVMQVIESCFCEDVHALTFETDPDYTIITVTLLCAVPARDGQ